MHSSKMRMDIDMLQSDFSKSYSSSGQPPSFGDVRQIVISEHSGSNQMYSDGQPPSINDVGRREPSQSEPSCTRYDYEGPDAHEVQKPSISDIGAQKNRINSELWQACAGPLVNLPAAGTHVVYFPQGHWEQVAAASMKKDAHTQIPHFPNLPSKLLCILHNITLHADTETDEVYAEMTLQPVQSFNKEGLLRADLLMKARKPQTEFFCKTLTASDTSTHGGFSVPRGAAEKIFPPLDFSMQLPTQELVARDLHDNVWTFRHIYRAQPKRHLLTTGWSLFVGRRRLFAGDSVLLTRDEKQQIFLGIIRANRQPASSLLSSDSMHIGLLAAAAHAAANNSPFTILYNPRASPSEFVIPLAKYYKSVCSNQISIGTRFQMIFETEELSVRRNMGTIVGISDLDDMRWKDSQWRNLKVEWDEGDAQEKGKRVSVWEIEPITAPFYSMNMQQTNHIQPNYLNLLAGSPLQNYERPDLSQQLTIENLQQQQQMVAVNQNQQIIPMRSQLLWFDEDIPMQDPDLTSYVKPSAGPVLQNHGGPDLSLHLGLLSPQILSQNNLHYNDQRSNPSLNIDSMAMAKCLLLLSRTEIP